MFALALESEPLLAGHRDYAERRLNGMTEAYRDCPWLESSDMDWHISQMSKCFTSLA